MGIDLSEHGSGYDDLLAHVGHEIACITYGKAKRPNNVALECIDCGVVLIDFDCPTERKIYLEITTTDADDTPDIRLVALTDKEYEEYLDVGVEFDHHVTLIAKETVADVLQWKPAYPPEDASRKGWIGLEGLK
jgi:hypothetical protein